MIVLDASVAVKWYLREADSEMAESLMCKEDFIAPDLIRIEMAAALCKGVKFKALTVEESLAHHSCWVGHLNEGLVTLIPSHEVMRDAISIAGRLSHPLQDCLYLAVAIQHKSCLITADEVLFKRAQREQWPVQLLAQYGTH